MAQLTTRMEPALYCLGGLTDQSLAETLGFGGFDAFESFKSKHESAREVSTFKAARVAAQDCRKSHFFRAKITSRRETHRTRFDPAPHIMHAQAPKYAFLSTYPQHPSMHARPLRVRRKDDASHRLGGAALDDVDLRRF